MKHNVAKVIVRRAGRKLFRYAVVGFYGENYASGSEVGRARAVEIANEKCRRVVRRLSAIK